tara:strand:- start:4839 stop:5759 length:921 start_codon:yes stop_codon:yes gene_type:complete
LPRSRKRYFSEDDFEIGVTPSQLKRTAKTRQLEYLTWWFRRMFEDPANQTPYNSEDGGYQYIWGGPYDARDELGNEFGGVVSDEVIEQVASEVENDGAEWAPGSDHPDHQRAREDFAEAEREEEDETYDLGFDLEEIEGRLDRGVKPQYGDDWERLRRLQILRDIDELQFMLPKDGEHGGMGHNQPPRDSRITDEDTAGVLEAVVVIRSELEKDEPDAKAVVKSAGLLQKILEGLARHLGTAAGEFTKNFGGAAGTAAGTAVGVGIGGGIVAAGAATFGMGDDLMSVLGGVVQSVGLWLQHVTLPF